MKHADEYADGYSHGVRWAEADRANHIPVADELERLREESAPHAQRWARAFYLGALRGYRAITRTRNTRGEWGT
jgi:hypothetical protein